MALHSKEKGMKVPSSTEMPSPTNTGLGKKPKFPFKGKNS